MFEVFTRLSETALKALKITFPTDSLKADIKNRILCFDDLERADPKAIPQLLGRINSYVEHDNLKVVIICEETKISYEGYSSIKEKLIGYSYNYLADPEKVIDHSIAQYSADRDYVDYISDKKSIILLSLNNSGQNNLRTLKRSISCFHKVYKACHDKVLNDDPILEGLLILIISLVCELKKDFSKKELLKNLFTSDFADWHLYFGADNDGKTFAKTYIGTYFVSGFDGLSVFASVFDFVTFGVLDKEKFFSELEALAKSKEIKEKSKKQLFYSEFWNLSDDEFLEIADNIIKSLSVEQKNIESLLRITEKLFYFSSKKLLKQTPEQLSDIINQSIDMLSNSGQLVCTNEGEFGLSLIGNVDDPYYLEIKKKLYEFNAEIREKKVKSDIINVLDKLEGNIDEAISSLYGGTSGGYKTSPIFCYYDHEKLMEIIKKFDCNKIIKFNQYMANRYQAISNIKGYLYYEVSALEAINDGLKDYLAELETEILKRYCISLLQETVEKGCAILKS